MIPEKIRFPVVIRQALDLKPGNVIHFQMNGHTYSLTIVRVYVNKQTKTVVVYGPDSVSKMFKTHKYIS